MEFFVRLVQMSLLGLGALTFAVLSIAFMVNRTRRFFQPAKKMTYVDDLHGFLFGTMFDRKRDNDYEE